MERYVAARDIPPSVRESMAQNARFSTVGFVRVKDDDGFRVPYLLGSGVLVSAGSTKAILTARHVLDILPKTGRLGIFLTPGSELETIDTGGIARVEFPRGAVLSSGPDLGAMILAPTIASLIGAKKTFFNLDRHRDTVLTTPRGVHDGIWLAQGFLQEKTTTTRESDGVNFHMYNFSAIGGPDEIVQVGDHEYVDYPVSFEARGTTPKDWGGMSGGGLWQIPLRLNADEITDGRPLLAGVLFFQHPTSDTTAGVRGHAWRSIYSVAYDEIRSRAF